MQTIYQRADLEATVRIREAAYEDANREYLAVACAIADAVANGNAMNANATDAYHCWKRKRDRAWERFITLQQEVYPNDR